VDVSTRLVRFARKVANHSGGRGVIFEPIVLETFIRTIGIVLHASAPSALDLIQMSREYWDLLLVLRSSSGDPAVAEAILFGMLAILEVTDPRVAAENFPKQVIETQAWAAGKSSQFHWLRKKYSKAWEKGGLKCWLEVFL